MLKGTCLQNILLKPKMPEAFSQDIFYLLELGKNLRSSNATARHISISLDLCNEEGLLEQRPGMSCSWNVLKDMNNFSWHKALHI